MSYATTSQLTTRFPHLASQNPVEQQAALDAASAWIDDFCQRRFTLDTSNTDRYFRATDWYVLDLGRYEIGNSTVTIKLDDGTGAYAQTLTTADYILEPVNAAADARPFTTVRAITFIWPRAWTDGERQDLVKITGKFGWPEVPDAVRQACLLLANDDFENPGSVRSEAIDGYSVTYGQNAVKTAEKLLVRYRRMWIA